MKTLRNLLTAVVILCGTLTMNAQSMSITAMRSNARFLTDRMAYTLGIRDPFLIDEIYRINYDYIYGVNGYLDDIALGYYYDDYMMVCDARDIALRNLLGISVWNRLVGYSYFHRPIIFSNRRWHFGIYDHDRYGVTYFHYAAPRPFGNGYAGGHFFGGMAPRGGRGSAMNIPAQGPGRGNRPNNNVPNAPRVDGNRHGSNVPNAPRADGNRPGSNVPNAPRADGNNGRGNNAPKGGNSSADRPANSDNPNRGASFGGRSQNNMQSSSRAGSTPASAGTSRTRNNSGMSPTHTSTGRSNAGTTRSSAAGSSRGSGSRTGGRR